MIVRSILPPSDPLVMRDSSLADRLGMLHCNLLFRPDLPFPVWDIGANAIAVCIPGGGYRRWPILDGVK